MEDLFPPPSGPTPVPVDTELRSRTMEVLQQQPSLSDLHMIAADIKDTLSAAIAELSIDVHAINVRLQEVEKTTAQQGTMIRHVNRKVDSHTLHLRDLHRQVEDLLNRSKRHNLRVINSLQL